MKYEIIYEVECDCGKSFITKGVKNNDSDYNTGVCIGCGETYKKKKKIKRRIDALTKRIIPEDQVTIL
jgi:hypothetical protein